MNRLQEATLDRLALAHGRTAVAEGYADEKVRVTVPSGAHFHIAPDGRPLEAGVDFSIDWSL